jgi:hypothetical protein
VQAAQLRLLDFMHHNQTGLFPTAIPFYSSLRMDHDTSMPDLLALSMMSSVVSKTTGETQRQVRKAGNQYHGISLYWDTYRLITTAVASLALAQTTVATSELSFDTSQQPHARYQCHNHCDYIARFALQPYLNLSSSVTSFTASVH